MKVMGFTRPQYCPNPGPFGNYKIHGLSLPVSFPSQTVCDVLSAEGSSFNLNDQAVNTSLTIFA